MTSPGEAARLGETLRDVHAGLREHFRRGPAVRRPRAAATMNARLEPRCPSYPARGVREGAAGGCSPTSADARRPARCSGCTATCTSARPCAPAPGWKIVDFEGEPAKTARRAAAARLAVARRRRDAARPSTTPPTSSSERTTSSTRPPGRAHAPRAESGPSATRTTSCRLRRRSAQPGPAAAPARRLRRRQGRLRDRLRDPQPPDLGHDPAPGRREDRSLMTTRQVHRPTDPAARSPADELDQLSAASTAARTRSSARTPTTAASPSVPSSRWRRRVVVRTATAPTYPLEHEHEGIWVGVSAGTRRARTTGSRSTYDDGATHVRRRPLPLPADAGRDGPAPDQRGSARAAVARCSAPGSTTTTRRSGTPITGTVVRGLGAQRPRGAAQGRLQQLGRSRAPDAPARPVRRLGAVRPRRRQRHGVQVRVLGADGQWREKADPMASYAEVPPLTPRGSSSRPTSGATRTWMAARAEPAARARADVGLRDAPRRRGDAARPGSELAERAAGVPVPSWASPTSS